jgi:hypothetical protein
MASDQQRRQLEDAIAGVRRQIESAHSLQIMEPSAAPGAEARIDALARPQ